MSLNNPPTLSETKVSGATRPENSRTPKSAVQPIRTVWPIAVVVMTTLAILYTLYFAAGLFIPIAISVFLTILLSPLVRQFSNWHIPRSLSSALIVGVVFSLLGTGFAFLAEPAEKWIKDAPQHVRQLKYQSVPAKGKLADIQELADEVDELKSVEEKNPTPTVVVKNPGFLEDFLENLPTMIAGTAVVIFLTYFLLLSGDGLLRKVTRLGRTWSERRRIVTIARHIQSDVSTYLGTLTIANCILGAATAGAMYFLEVPNPLLWGVMVGIFNFAPYIGALVSMMVLGLVGFATFDSLADSLAVPGVFLMLTTLEGQLITPMVLGRRMSLSPAVIFLSVIVWGWIWGVAGALMAVPIVTSLKVVFEYFPPFRLLENLSQQDLRPQTE